LKIIEAATNLRFFDEPRQTRERSARPFRRRGKLFSKHDRAGDIPASMRQLAIKHHPDRFLHAGMLNMPCRS
jgi:hypothetical protein